MTPAPRKFLLAAFLVAALPLAGCGNKGPLILAPSPTGGPPPPEPLEAPAEAATVAPPSASTVVPPSEPTVEPPAGPPAEPPTSPDGTSGNPR